MEIERSTVDVLDAACCLILCVLDAGNPADYIAEISCKYGLLTLTAETKYTYFANPDGSIGQSADWLIDEWMSGWLSG